VIKKRLAATGVCVCALGIGALAQDVLSQLGITPLAARVAVESVISSGIHNPGLPAKAFKLLPAAARAQMATAGVAWLKAYTASAEFTRQYGLVRQAHKPTAPQFEGTPEDELKKADEEQARQAEESKKAIAALPPEQRAQIERAMSAAQAMTAQMNTPETRKSRLEAIASGRADRMKEHAQAIAAWTRDYPENPAPIVTKRLREFLAISADVDFGAALTSRNGKMVFENQGYEEKPAQWKLCYRAGKEATTAARAAVEAWLKELGA
jgi:hypothetical protein